MGKYLILLLTLLTGCASAVSLRNADIVGKDFTPGGRDLILLPNDEPHQQVELKVNTDLFKYGYWDNRVWGLTNQSKFSATGWNYHLGLRLSKLFDVEYEHHSQHRLDAPFPPNVGFPVEDSFNVIFHVYSRDPGNATLF